MENEIDQIDKMFKPPAQVGGYIITYLEKNPEGSPYPYTTKTKFLQVHLKEKFMTELGYKGLELTTEEVEKFINDNK